MTSIQKHFFWLVFLVFVFQNKTLENKMKISGNGYTVLIQLGVALVLAGELAQAVRCLSMHEVLLEKETWHKCVTPALGRRQCQLTEDSGQGETCLKYTRRMATKEWTQRLSSVLHTLTYMTHTNTHTQRKLTTLKNECLCKRPEITSRTLATHRGSNGRGRPVIVNPSILAQFRSVTHFKLCTF